VAALAQLLDRFCAQPERLSVDQRLKSAKEAAPTAITAWTSWCEAERAMRAEQPTLALAWLDIGWVHLAGSGDALCRLELVTLEARAWAGIDEPRRAYGVARASCQGWREVLTEIGVPAILASVRDMLAALSRPHPPAAIEDIALLTAWNEDRFAPALGGTTRQLIGLCGDLGTTDEAEKVAEDYAEWNAANARRLGASPEINAHELASLDLALGDAFDRNGQRDRALEIFQRGLAAAQRLQPSRGLDGLKAQLEFNIAGQIARQGRHAEAEAEYARSCQHMTALGWDEPALRARYAELFERWKQGRRDDLTEPVLKVAEDYERILAATTSVRAEKEARQGLDLAYRLLLRLRIDSFDASDPVDAQLLMILIFVLKEEEGKYVRICRQVAAEPGRTIHSEITVLAERLARRPDSALLIVEQVPEALLFVTLRSGSGPWHRSLHLTLIPEVEAGAVSELITRHVGEVSALSNREIPVVSAPDPAFLASCQAVWSLLTPECKRDLSGLGNLFLTVDYRTDIDQLPVDLLHDGETFLGLRTCVSHFPSLRDMAFVLGENRINAAPTGKALIVRAEDKLPQAAAEMAAVEQAFGDLGIATERRMSPDRQALLNELGQGVDLLHYVGHGLADKVGESLPLGPGNSLSARDVQALGDAPAPLCLLSACLAGRGRHLRSGEQQGFATALLRRGAPAVVAAQFAMPDFIGTTFWSYFYHALAGAPLGDAMLAARRQLAVQGHHPAAWSAFVIFGEPGTRVAAPHLTEATTWTAHALRLVATGAASHREAASTLLDGDERLSDPARDAIRHELDAVVTAPAGPMDEEPADAGVPIELRIHTEVVMASTMLRAAARLRHDSARPGGWTPTRDRGQMDLAQRTLGDTYLLVALAHDLARGSDHLTDARQTFLRGARLRRWLNGDPDLVPLDEGLKDGEAMLGDTLVLDAAAMSGVDRSVYQDADEGDREAQKRLLSALWRNEARPEATISGDWKPWFLRAIGAGGSAELADALGAIDAARRDARLTEERAKSLVTLVERFVGPGEIEPKHADRAQQLFTDASAERRVVELFLLYDRIASSLDCDLDKILAAADTSLEMGSTAAAGYFLGIAAERLSQARQGDNACDLAARALDLYQAAVAEDEAYRPRCTLTAFLLVQSANLARRGDQAAEALALGLGDVEAWLARDDPRAHGPDGMAVHVRPAVLLLMLEGRSAEARDLARRAEKALDPETRAELDAALGLAPHFPPAVDAIARHGSDQLHAGGYIEAIEWLGEAVSRLDAADDKAAMCGVLGDLAVAFRNADNNVRAEGVYRRAIALCDEVGDDVNLSRWSQNLGLLLNEAGERDEGRQQFLGGLAAAERSGNGYQISCAHGNLGILLQDDGDVAAAAEAFRKALAAAPNDQLAEQWRTGLQGALARQGMAFAEAGDLAAALPVQQELVALLATHEASAPELAAAARLRLAALLGDSLKKAEALAQAQAARRLFEAAGNPDGVRAARQIEARIQSGSGVIEANTAEAPEDIAARVAAAVAASDIAVEMGARLDLVQALSRAGSPEVAAEFDKAVVRALASRETRHEMNLALNFALWFLEAGNTERAGTLARRAVELAQEARPPFRILAELHLARVLDEGEGDADAACTHYRNVAAALAPLLGPDGELPEFMQGSGGDLARGTQLVMRTQGAEAGIDMLSLWNPTTAAPLRDEAGGGAPPEALGTVLAAWRAAAAPGDEGEALAGGPADEVLTGMARVAEITGWSEAENRLERSRRIAPAPADVPQDIAGLMAAIARPEPDLTAIGALGVADDDLACLVLYAIASPELGRDGRAYQLLQAVAALAGDGRLAARACNFLGMFDRDAQAKSRHSAQGAARLAGGEDDGLRAHLLAEQAAVLLELEWFEQARDVSQQALELADTAGEAISQAAMTARGNLAVALMNLQQPDAALEILESLAALQAQAGDQRGLEATRSNISACKVRMGDLDGASFV
jgi:hypothetical protein